MAERVEGSKVAVLGGGPAGLTAAWHLARSGAQVTLFEARHHVGGRMRTDPLDGFRVDVFVQLFGSMYREFFRVLAEIGGEYSVVRSPGRDALLRNGRVHEVTYGSVSSMLASGALPMRTKLRLGAKYLPYLARHASHLHMHDLAAASDAGLDRESIASWGARELGEEFVEYLVYPLLASYYGVLPEETSAALYHLLAHYGTNVTVSALRGGTGTFAELLAARISELDGTIRTGARVDSVSPEEEGITVETEAGRASFDGAAVCLPAPQIAERVHGLDPALLEWFRGVRHRPLGAVALVLESPIGAGYFGLSFPRTEAATVATVCLEENKGPGLGLVPPGRGLLVALLTPEAAEGAAEELDAQRLVDRVVGELRRVFPDLDTRVTRAKVYRWIDGGALFYPGYLRHLAAFPAAMRAHALPIVFAGDYLVAPGVEGSVVSGLRAADRLVAGFRRVAR